ncbi:hypothetical protein BGZ63DRAFT_408669 [Mariannaea sp. PMI_226]|nr:hypothetical protein BGZ63DRAFT_408669 [Mariannaea sp. PMI_226]
MKLTTGSILARQNQFTLTGYKGPACKESESYTWPIGLDIQTEQCFSWGDGTESIRSVKIGELPEDKCVLVKYYGEKSPCGHGYPGFKDVRQNECVLSVLPPPPGFNWNSIPDQGYKSVGVQFYPCLQAGESLPATT